jgi:hypothetical protein
VHEMMMWSLSRGVPFHHTSPTACVAIPHFLVAPPQGAHWIGKLLFRAPLMEDFKMASSRVGPTGGRALAMGLTAGDNITSSCKRDCDHISDG